MGEGRLKFNPLIKKTANNKLDAMVSFGSETKDKDSQYHERIKKIIKKLQEISERVDKLAGA